MRGRTLILFVVAIMLAGGTAMLVRSWLDQQHTVEVKAAAPSPAVPQKSILVARSAIARGQKLKVADLGWQPWPEAGIDQAYIQSGSKPIETFAGRVAREPFVPGEPITEAKTVEPGNGGVLAAVLAPGKRAVSVPLNPTSDVSGFIFPGDQVDVVLTETQQIEEGDERERPQRKASETVLRDIRVIAVDQKIDNKNGQVEIAKTATLEVTPKQSEIITLAGEMGKLSLSLRSLLDSPNEKLVGDSLDDGGTRGYTLEREVSPLLRRPTPHAHTPVVLHGTGKSG